MTVPYLRGFSSTRFLFDEAKFSGVYSHRTIEDGVGQNLPREAPGAVADAVLAVGGRA